MKRLLLVFLVLVGCVAMAGTTFGQVYPGKTVEERCVNAAKDYVKKHNLKEPVLNVLQISLFKQAHPKYDAEWERLTGVKIKPVVYGYTDIPSKIMAEAVAKTGRWDVFMHFAEMIPDASGAGVIAPLDKWAKKINPDFSGYSPSLRASQYYDGKLYHLLLDGDHLILVLRKDIMDAAAVDYQKKFGQVCDCPETIDEWEQMPAYFHTKKGETRWGIKFDQPMYGAIGYRTINFAYRHFAAYFAGLYFDKDMNPQINTPQGIQAIKQFASVKYMPEDILGWSTAQIYPFWGSGQAFSVMAFPSIVGFANANPKSKIKGKQLSCIIPGQMRNGVIVRRSPQAAGTGYFVSSYAKHPELAYYYIQWLTSPTKGEELIADPKGFWDPCRFSNLENEAIIRKFGKQFLDATLHNARYAVSLLTIQGNFEYQNVLEKNLILVLQGLISAKEAAKRIEKGWNEVTEDIGRDDQIKTWRKLVESGAYVDVFK
jgi:multiple sugar transport system substrate-binding protein